MSTRSNSTTDENLKTISELHDIDKTKSSDSEKLAQPKEQQEHKEEQPHEELKDPEEDVVKVMTSEQRDLLLIELLKEKLERDRERKPPIPYRPEYLPEKVSSSSSTSQSPKPLLCNVAVTKPKETTPSTSDNLALLYPQGVQNTSQLKPFTSEPSAVNRASCSYPFFGPQVSLPSVSNVSNMSFSQVTDLSFSLSETFKIQRERELQRQDKLKLDELRAQIQRSLSVVHNEPIQPQPQNINDRDGLYESIIFTVKKHARVHHHHRRPDIEKTRTVTHLSKSPNVSQIENDVVHTQAQASKYDGMINGAILLFSSNDLIGTIIRCCDAKCKVTDYATVSHIGVFYNGFVLESTGSVSQILQGIYPQVQFRPYKEVVKEYNGEVAYRNPLNPFNEINVSHYVGVPYEKRFVELLASVINANRHENPSSLFCSELAAYVIRDEYPSVNLQPNNVTPREFLPFGNSEIDRFYENKITYLKRNQ